MSPSPTIAELLEAWGPPPRAVLEDWIEQLRQQLRALQRRTAECHRAPPGLAAALTLEAIRIDPQNRLTAIGLDALHHSLTAATVSPADECGTLSDPVSPAELHPDYRLALHEFARQIDPRYAENDPLAATETEGEGGCHGAEPAGANLVGLATGAGEISATGKNSGEASQSAGKSRPRRRWIAGAALVLLAAGFPFLTLNRGEQSAVLDASSTAGAKDPTAAPAMRSENSDEDAKEFESFANEPTPQTQAPAENDASDLLDRFSRVGGESLPASEPLLFDDDPPDDQERTESASGQPSRADQESRSSGLENRAAGEEDSVAEADSVMAAESRGGEEIDLESTVDSALDRPAPIIDDPSADAVILPPLDEDAVSARLHPVPAEEVSLELLGPPIDGEPRRAANPPLRLVAETEHGSDDFAAWEIVEAKEKVPAIAVGHLFSDRSGTHFGWSPDVPKRLANELRNGRLRLDFAEARPRPLFLRPPQQTEPVDFDFQQQQLEIAWRLSTPPHPSASRLHIDFQLPEAIEYAWIEPPEMQPPRDLVAIAEFKLDESESVALRIRFDVQTGSRLVSRVRYAARIDATLPWQWVTMPDVIEEADQIGMQHAAILANLRQIDAVDGRRGARSQREMLRRRREELDRRSKQLVSVAERLGHLMQLMHSLQNEGQIGWRLITEWPDRRQTIFATPFG